MPLQGDPRAPPHRQQAPGGQDRSFRILPQETGGKNARFAVTAQSGEQIANWDGILADPQILLDSDAHRAAQVTRAEVRIDGRALAVPVRPVQEVNQYPGLSAGKFQSTAGIHPTSYNPGGLLAEIARGTTMTVRLYVGNREVSYWTFDVSRLRHMPAALKGARWTCRKAIPTFSPQTRSRAAAPCRSTAP